MGGAAGGCGKDAIFRNSSFGYGGAGYNTNSTTSFSFVSGEYFIRLLVLHMY